MKLQLALLLGAACALCGVAGAQEKFGSGDRPGVQLRDVPGFGELFDRKPGAGLRDTPNIGPLFRDPSAPSRPRLLLPQRDPKSLFGPQFPPAPTLDAAQESGTRVRVLKVKGDEILQVEIVRQSVAQVLKQLTAVMGVRTVIDPQLDKEQLTTLVLRGRNFDELLRGFNFAAEMVKSPAGTYFFGVAPRSQDSVTFLQMPDGTYRRFDGLPLPNGTDRLFDDRLFDGAPRLREVPPRAPAPNGPFSFGPGEFTPHPDPDFVMPVNPGPLVPQPDWEKREFNGREFYFVPAPIR